MSISDESRTLNQGVQRTGASRFAQIPIERHRRLAPVADLFLDDDYTTRMKTGDFKLWRSPVVCWWLFALFCVLTVIWQIITVKPYPDMQRDWLILTFGCGGAAFSFLIMGIRASRQRRRDDTA